MRTEKKLRFVRLSHNSQREHECYKRYCKNCNQNREVGHLCFTAPLVDMVPPSYRVLYVFYDFETTQNARYSEQATVHVPNFVCVQQICSRCEGIADVEQDCEHCGRRRHSFWLDPAGNLLSYLCEPCPWADRIVAIAHNAKSFDSQFILNRAILLKWRQELIMNGMRILCL
jgi:hypothetical protein